MRKLFKLGLLVCVLALGMVIIGCDPNGGGTAPTVTTTSLPNGTVGTAYSQTLTATGDAPITWTVDSGTLPNGLALSEAGAITGTPTTSGISPFTVKATNATGNNTKALSITITTVGGGVAPTVTTTSLPNGTIGTTYSQTLTATGDAPINWTIDTGTLPAGLTLSGATISGTPTATGTSNFTVKATNEAGDNTKALSIVIATVPVAPTVTTTSLPGGAVGSPYSQTLTATGDAPINWTIDTGTLPAGLSLSTTGTISGTPTTTGTSNFTVKATNGAGNNTKALSIVIGPSVDTALNGNWDGLGEMVLRMNNGSFEIGTEVNVYYKGTYTTTGDSITLTVTHYANGEGAPLLSRSEYKSAYLAAYNEMTEEEKAQIDAQAAGSGKTLEQYIDAGLDTWYISQTGTYSISGNTLTLTNMGPMSATLTKLP